MTKDDRIKELEDALWEVDQIRHKLNEEKISRGAKELVSDLKKFCMVLYNVHVKDRLGGRANC